MFSTKLSKVISSFYSLLLKGLLAHVRPRAFSSRGARTINQASVRACHMRQKKGDDQINLISFHGVFIGENDQYISNKGYRNSW